MVTVIGKVALVPTATLPKPRDAGLGVRYWLVTPVPEAPVQKDLAETELVVVMASPSHPIVVGVKATLKVTLFPAPRLMGRLRPLTTNCARPEFTAESVTLVEPVLVRVTGKVSLCPIMMLANRSIVGVHVSCWGAADAATGSIPNRANRVMVTDLKEKAAEERDDTRGGRIAL